MFPQGSQNVPQSAPNVPQMCPKVPQMKQFKKKMAENQFFMQKIKILRSLLFLKLWKLDKIKCPQNFGFTPKK